MNIRKITLCQNENRMYNKLPRNLNSDYNPCYEFQYPFAFEIACDCERIVFKLLENKIVSDICKSLMVVFITDSTTDKAELMDFIAFEMKSMRFVNVYVNPDSFNSCSNEEKRKIIFEKIYEAIILVAENEKKDLIKQVCEEVYLKAEETECVFLNRALKKYSFDVKFKSSMNRYDAILYITNNITHQQQRTVLFEKGSFADLEYRIRKIIVKKNQCIIQPKDDKIDDSIIVDIEV